MFVAFVTNTSAQTCFNSNTNPGSFACAGDNLLWTSTSFGIADGTILTWTITADTSGGAKFSNGLQSITSVSAGNINSILVTMGDNPGSVTVLMTFPGNPAGTSCSSSGVSKVVVVEGNAPAVLCPNELTTITATDFGTVITAGGDPAQFPGGYLFTLHQGTAAGPIVAGPQASNVFANIAPGAYVIEIEDTPLDGSTHCHGFSQVINIINPVAVALDVTCPVDRHDAACTYADQASLDAAFIAWLNTVQTSGGINRNPVEVIPDAAGAPDKCGGIRTVRFVVTDACGQRDECTAIFEVLAATAPNIQCVAAKLIACNAQFEFDAPTPSGICGPLVVNIISTVVSPDGLSSTRTWDVSNLCGIHSVQCSQVVTREVCELNGCTLGYWKNHTKAWCDAYTTCTLYKDVFSGSTLAADLTLLQALNLKGNTGCENLARQSVAALLNICEGLPFGIPTIDGVNGLVAQVNAAFAGGTCNALGAKLDGFNNEGGVNHCNVEKSPNTSAPSESCVAIKQGINLLNSTTPTNNFTPTKNIGISRFIASPNPYTTNFNLDITTDSDSPLDVNVYDMLGRRIENKSLRASESKNIQLGEGYPIGVYNVILKQATEVKTLRVVKEK